MGERKAAVVTACFGKLILILRGRGADNAMDEEE